MFNRNHMLVGGVRPHLYCLPILKRNIHQQALRELVASGFNRVFLGTDSAPRTSSQREQLRLRGLLQRPNRAGQLRYRL